MEFFHIDDQWQDRNPTDAERLGLRFVEQVLEIFKEELEKAHGTGDDLEAIKDHARGQIWLHLCSFVWRANGSVSYKLPPLPPFVLEPEPEFGEPTGNEEEIPF